MTWEDTENQDREDTVERVDPLQGSGSDPQAELASLIRGLVENSGRSLRELEAVSKISKTAWSDYQCGSRRPPARMLEIVLSVTNASQGQRERADELWGSCGGDQEGRLGEGGALVGFRTIDGWRSHPEHWGAILTVAATLAIVVLGTGICIVALVMGAWWSASSSTSKEPLPGDSSVVNAVERRCARVNVATSPVWSTVGDIQPLKWKFRDDRVRLLNVPVKQTPNGAYQAVAVPKDGPQGAGWMPNGDLTPASCAGLA